MPDCLCINRILYTLLSMNEAAFFKIICDVFNLKTIFRNFLNKFLRSNKKTKDFLNF